MGIFGQGKTKEPSREVEPSQSASLHPGDVRLHRSPTKTEFDLLELPGFLQCPRICRGRLSQCIYRLWVQLCRKLSQSRIFSAITTILTIVALFGDDARLMFFAKPTDYIFNYLVLTCMVAFGTEIIAFTFGKAEYFLGFFFWLDLMATVSLVFDLTYIAEDLFGDNLGGGDASEPANDDPGNAARAARMSRAGTKAGRVVRLIRLVRLFKMVKLYKKGSYQETKGREDPGMDWDDDDEEQNLEKESAVSKKLSEATTRRVIVLVLIIMLAVSFFQTSMYIETLMYSSEYGANQLYRTWAAGLAKYGLWNNPAPSATQRMNYLLSTDRRRYVDDFYMYIYYHNPVLEIQNVPDGKVASSAESLSTLFWMGAAPTTSPLCEFFLPRFQNRTAYDLNSRWNGKHWSYYQGNLTSDPISLLNLQWGETNECLSGNIRGVSLLEPSEPRLKCPEQLRFQERRIVYPTAVTKEENEVMYFLFVFDNRAGSAMEAGLNTAQTIFICLLLGLGSLAFSNDANQLVLMPIERMISKIDKIRNNPLAAMTIGDEEHRREEAAEARKSALEGTGRNNLHQDSFPVAQTPAGLRGFHLRVMMLWARFKLRFKRQSDKQAPEPMETVVLEKTIIKIGSLLALGFGEAGASIIGQNMKGGDTSALNAMIPGRRVDAIFGFCNIRNFTDATEVLQDQVMVFVNSIAGVVHSTANEFFGSPNKNIGDAFLLCWSLSAYKKDKHQRLADMALISLVKIVAEVNKSSLLAEYRNHPKLIKRLPNYRVRLGFGMHEGWAIEGAIGSEFKIDASYLSPNVNIASRLEAVTSKYGVMVLISDAIHNLMSIQIAEECRIIDHVKLSGGREAVELWTIDLDDLALEVEKKPHIMARNNKTKFKLRNERQKKRNERWADDFIMHEFFESDPDIKTLRSKFTPEFLCRFNMAYLNYEAGEWDVAKDMLETTRFMLVTEDGPSTALLAFMKLHNWIAPEDWQGFRVLAER